MLTAWTRSYKGGMTGRTTPLVRTAPSPKTVPLYHQVLERLANLIVTERYAPGAKLPSERELVQRFQVSRSSLREALRAASLLGIVEIRYSEGTYVKHPSLMNFVSLFTRSLQAISHLENRIVWEVWEARNFLEANIAELAAEKISPEELSELRAELAAMKQYVFEPPRYLVSDFNFHKILASSTRNRILEMFIVSIQDFFLQALRRPTEVLAEGSATAYENLYVTHERIYEAIAKKDPVAARQAMIEHMEAGKRYLGVVFGEIGLD